MKLRIALFAASAIALAAGSAGAEILFDNGPTNGTLSSVFVNGSSSGGQAIYDTFTATGSGAVDELQIGLWVPHGETPTGITWWLGTTFFDNSIGGGTVGLSASNYVFLNSNSVGGGAGYDVYEVTLTGLSSTMLTAGDTYVLTLGDGTDSSGDRGTGWDINDGPAACGALNAGSDLGSCSNFGFGSEAFTLSTAAPEPAAWALMLAGIAGLGGALRARRRLAAI